VSLIVPENCHRNDYIELFYKLHGEKWERIQKIHFQKRIIAMFDNVKFMKGAGYVKSTDEKREGQNQHGTVDTGIDSKQVN
jgi:hypothetical protein